MTHPEGLNVRPQDLGFGRLFESVRDAVIVAEAGTGRIVLWNPAATEIFGYSRSEALDELRVEALVPERLKAQHLAGISRYRDTGHGPYIDSRTVLDLPAVRKTGEEIRVEFTLNPVESADASRTEERLVLAIMRDVTQRKRAEEEIRRMNEDLERRVAERTAELQATVARLQSSEQTLRESEERYRLLVESAEDYAIFAVNPEGHVASWNAGAERVFGYSEEEIVGKHGSLLFTLEDLRRGADEEELRRAREEGRAQDERWHVRRDGTRFWASGFVRPVRDEAGNLRGFTKVARDTTERKKAEERARFLADLSQALQPLADPDEAMTATARLLGEHLGADRCAYAEVEADEDHFRITGDYARGVPSIVGRFAVSQFGAEALRLMRADEPYVVADAEADERVAAEDLTAYRQTQIRAVVSVPLHKAGRFVAGLAVHQKTPRRWSPEEVELVATVANRCWESIERARAEKTLRRSEERYRSLVASSTSVVWTVDPEGRFAEPQPSWEAYTGQPWEEHRGFGWIRALHPDDRGRVGETWERARDRCSLYESEGRLWHAPSGTYRYFVARATPLLDTDGSVREWIGMVTDVNDQKRAEKALRFLAEASTVLSSSLDYRETLVSLARLTVPHLADWCAVDILEEDGSVRRLAVAHEDPEKVRWAHQLQRRYPDDPSASQGVPQVLRSGRSEFYPEITDEVLAASTRDSQHLKIMREVGLTSAMIVPLVGRERTLGAISLVSAESGRRYGKADLELAEELAGRAALAVDNARLYQEAKNEISERESAEEQLKSSRDQLEIILEGVTDGIIAQESSGRLIYANQAAARIVGYPSARALIEASSEEIMKGFEIMDESGRPFPLAQMPGRLALRGERGPEALLRFREVATGEERWAMVDATPVFDEEGRVRFAVNIFRDMTELKHAEEVRARLAAIVESSDDAIIGKSLEGVITSWNRGAHKLYGYSAEEAVGQPITILVPPELSDEIPAILSKVKRGEAIEHYETVRVSKDGRRFDVSLTVSPVRDSAGNVTGASTIARDITERKRAEEEIRILNEDLERRVVERTRQLKEANEELESFSYSVSHDLRAPLRHIDGFARLLQKRAEASLDETDQRYLNNIVESTDHAGDLIDDLLAFSRTGRAEIHRADVDMNRLVREALDDLKLETYGRSIECAVGELHEVRGDPSMLRLVLQNLLSNAVKYTSAREQAVIEVGSKAEGDQAIFFVSDNGVGFDMEYVDKLFGVFQRLHRAEEFEGTGIGLATVRRIVNRHGGRVWAEGSVGSGATFYFSLPLVERRNSDATG